MPYITQKRRSRVSPYTPNKKGHMMSGDAPSTKRVTSLSPVFCEMVNLMRDAHIAEDPRPMMSYPVYIVASGQEVLIDSSLLRKESPVLSSLVEQKDGRHVVHLRLSIIEVVRPLVHAMIYNCLDDDLPYRWLKRVATLAKMYDVSKVTVMTEPIVMDYTKRNINIINCTDLLVDADGMGHLSVVDFIVEFMAAQKFKSVDSILDWIWDPLTPLTLFKVREAFIRKHERQTS